MLTFWEFLTALVVSLVVYGLVVILILKANRRREGVSWIWWLLLWTIIFVVTWAGGLWLQPIGPLIFGGVPVLSFIFTAVAISLLIAALVPPPPELPPAPGVRLTREEVLAGQAHDHWRWMSRIGIIFVIAMVITIVLAYI